MPKGGLIESITKSQAWKSIFRHGAPDNPRNRVLVVLMNVFLHLHPIRMKKSGVRMSFTWCMGGLTFFLFIVETITGVLLMFYYRPTADYAYADMIALREHVPIGIMREVHRWGAHAMVITVWLHMFRVFLTGSHKPPPEFNWNVGAILLSRSVRFPECNSVSETINGSFERNSACMGDASNFGDGLPGTPPNMLTIWPR